MGILRRDPDVVFIDNSRTEQVTRHVTIEEHRAPTDESVRLLKEMEAAVEQKVVESIRVADTAFECVVRVERDMMQDGLRMRAVFKLNGKTMTADHFVDNQKFRTGNTLDVVHGEWTEMRDATARVIASEILAKPFTEALANVVPSKVRS